MIGFSVRIPTSREAAKMMESSKPSISLLLAVNLKKSVDANKSFQSIQAEMKNVKIKKLKNVEVIETLNERVSEFDFMPTPAGEYAGEIIISVIKVKGKYKALKNFIETKLFKTKTKIDRPLLRQDQSYNNGKSE